MKIIPCLLLFLLAWTTLPAQQILPLYDGRPAGSEDWMKEEKTIESRHAVVNVTEPSLTAYLPPKTTANGTAVIIAPGGGFHFLSFANEGTEVARWLNTKGVAAFVLKYRLVQTHTDDPWGEFGAKMSGGSLQADFAMIAPLAMRDGLAAVRYVRKHAADFNVDPERIGFMGFSAGATVTMSVVYNATDADRPDFVAPIYLYDGAVVGSTVPSARTPIFVAVAGDDQLGLMPHSLKVYQKWREAGQPAELHVYERGGHGFGARRQGASSDFWLRDFENWLEHQRLLMSAEAAARHATNEAMAGRARNQEARENRMRMDWAYLERYQEENKKLGPPKKGEQRVVFLGNSITENWARMDSAWFARHHFVGRGISGQTSPQALLRFRQDVLDLQPAAVVILMGTNDVAQNTGYIAPEQTLANIASMAELAQAHGVAVVIASVLPAYDFSWRPGLEPADKILQLNQLLKDYAADQGFTYLDFHTALKDQRNGLPLDYAEDGVHPNLKAYREVMAPLAEQAVAAALATRK